MRESVWFSQDRHNFAEGGFALLTLLVSFYLFFFAYDTLISIRVVSPAWPLMTLFYWRKRWPSMGNVGIFWCVGFLLDLLSSSVMGTQALAFLITYGAITIIQRARFVSKNIYSESLSVFLIVFVFQSSYLLIQWSLGMLHFSIFYFTQSILSMLLWPWFVVCLHFFHRFFKSGR